MHQLPDELKHWTISLAIDSMSAEFVRRHHRHGILDELPDFVDTYAANTGAILQLLEEHNVGMFPSVSRLLTYYPNFWVDFSRNLELERIPRSLRPARTVT